MKNSLFNNKFICIAPELNFLKTLADELFHLLKDPKNRFKVVFPHRRAGIYLRYYLSQHELPLMLPRIYSIEDFIDEIFVSIDPRPQIPVLDLIYIVWNFLKDKQVFSKFATIDKFLPWGFYIAEAIDEIDMEMIEIKDLRSVHLNALSSFVSEIGDLLGDIYEFLNQIRRQKEYYFSTKGERFRVVAEHINQDLLDDCVIILAGFSFVTSSENKIFRFLVDNGAKLAVEGNASDLERVLGFKPPNESILEIGPKLNAPKKISIYKANDFHHALVDIKEKDLLSNNNNRPDKNLILVADASKLLAVISFHPKEIPLNVTMGFPFLNTQLGMFLSLWFKLILGSKEGCVFTQYLISWLNHNYFSKRLEDSGTYLDQRKYIRDLDKALRNSAPRYVSKELILQILEISNLDAIDEIKEFVTWLFERAILPHINNLSFNVNPKVVLHDIKEFLDLILVLDEVKEDGSGIGGLMSQFDQISYYYFLSEIYWPICGGRFGKASFNSIYSVFNLLYQLISVMRVPISSKPLVGNQAMGLLETRLLSFERVIVLEANEGVLPSLGSLNPIFPEQLKRALPNKKFTEEMIQRYHFKRLLSASKEIHIYYLDRKKEGDGKKGSKSRFLEEIQWEAQRYGTYDMVEEPLKFIKIAVSRPRHSISKDERIKNFIKEWLRSTPISASIINTYLRCQVQFFYKYILGLEVPDELSDTTSREFGSLIHEVLQCFLKRYENCGIVKLGPNDKTTLIKIFEERLSNSIVKIRLDEVRYKMLREIARYRLSEFFEILREKTDSFNVSVLGTEVEFKDLELKLQRIDFPINLVGRYDCIMQIDNEHWIFDFKTGAPKKISQMINFKKLNEFGLYIGDDLERVNASFQELCEIVKDFQLMLYAFAYHLSTQIKELNGSYIYLSATKDEMEQVLFKEELEADHKNRLITKDAPSILELVLFHLLNYDYFEQPTDKDFCKTCRICG